MQIGSEETKIYFNPKEAANYISQHLWRHTETTLATYRSIKKDLLKFYKRGHRVFYHKADVDSYIEKRLRSKFSPE